LEGDMNSDGGKMRQRLWLLVGVVVAAAVVVGALALASGGDNGPQGLGDGSSLQGQAEVNRTFAGIPQQGIADRQGADRAARADLPR
jgi:hypothetical protein